MKIYIGIIAAILVNAGIATPINHAMVNTIKKTATTWTPMEVHENPLAHLSEEEIKGLLGTQLLSDKNEWIENEDVSDLPANFDWREETLGTPMEKCIHEIRNQAQCGSCWAFGAAETLSDRFCLATEGEFDEELSPQDMVSCDYTNMGCNGGILATAWEYLVYNGITTEKCRPYTAGGGNVHKCQTGKCFDNTETCDYKKYKCSGILPTVKVTEKSIK